jgi:hypothetical protein
MTHSHEIQGTRELQKRFLLVKACPDNDQRDVGMCVGDVQQPERVLTAL